MILIFQWFIPSNDHNIYFFRTLSFIQVSCEVAYRNASSIFKQGIIFSMSYMIRYRVNTDSVNTTLLLGILSGNKIDFKILRICEISLKKKNLFFLKKNLSISKEILSPSFFFFRSSS